MKRKGIPAVYTSGEMQKRNSKCSCGSGRKAKRCCLVDLATEERKMIRRANSEG